MSSPPTRSRRPNLAGDETGAATVFAAILVAALVAITLGGVHIGGAVVARHRAQAGADMAALAAAMWLPRGADSACRQAAAVTRAMGTVLRQCDIAELDVVVAVEAATGRLIGGRAHAAARAGPLNVG
ncbi:flp pilus-assembly TadE/G-like family protein [Mycobacterium sp. CVI_P3]|uniref:Flp pilus-assembly TadE/G-like family protein n=1 Tax=Mycobacterium pinniadriaticum TaxID=2994102 RepID=A0ABT3SJB0_9MYCO|nr:Rv3654c family TadE-like protein [Mycobacterium pinniadriaticum]MCX2933095.1 flp pilus-assembly TadE/G-like family protein [Mycobacterium pinniadriaticum]MCX2939605.1 flp pilus-assembly TadE/G-like family protein [Mycobacterium pinniadriaticum]